jgi:hypothetical protein
MSRDAAVVVDTLRFIQVAWDRGTAYVSAGAMDHVIRDLKKNL